MNALGKALLSASVLALGTAAASQQAWAAVTVDLELSLLVDVSGSVDNDEFVLQRDGYVNAFKSAAIQNAITSTANGRLGKIATNLIYWSSSNEQIEAVAWSLIDSAASSDAFADAIAAAARPFNGLTAPGSAINFAVPGFASNDFDSNTQVIDVSGDGAENDGANTPTARDAALAAGVERINGLPILGSQFGLLEFYQLNIQGGTGSFTIAANDFAAFGDAVAKKIELEIIGPNPIPLPAPVFLLIGGLFGMGALVRRKRTA